MKGLFIAICVWSIILVPCCAMDSADELKNALPQEAREILQTVDPGSMQTEKGVSALWEAAVSRMKIDLRQSMKSAFQMAGVCLLLSLVQSFAKSAGTPLPNQISELAGTTAVLLLAMGQSSSMLSLCRETVEKLECFTKVLITAFTVSSAAAGRPASAVAAAGAAMLSSDLILTLVKSVFLPGITWYLLLVYGGIIAENGALKQAAAVGKWAMTNFFKFFLTGYFAYLTFTGLVTGRADAAAVKTAQSLSGSVPLVGSVIAGASETILSGAALLRAGIGTFGALGAVAICLTPFVQGLCHLLVFRVLSVFSASFAEGGLRTMLDGISNVYSMLLGMLAACCAVQFITIVVSMTVTGP